MGKGGKCLDGKGWKVPGCERVESALIGKGRVPERERTESFWMGKGGNVLDGKGWKVSGWERMETA